MMWLWSVAHALEPGPYALEVTIVTESRLPVIGTKRVTTTSQVLARLREGPDGWVQQQRTCAVLVEGGGPATTTIPPAFVAALPVQEIPVDLSDGYRVDGGPTTLGAEADGPLPRRAEDPGVKDSDGDGQPGVTVWVDAPVVGRVEMYVVQRAHSVLLGKRTETGAEGAVDVRQMEQWTLGASHKLLAANPTLTVVAEASRFRLVSVAEGSCEAVGMGLREAGKD